MPSAHLRQQKLDQQRQLIEQKQKAKRQQVNVTHFLMTIYQNHVTLQGKLIQASDLKSETVKSRGRPLSGRRELHGYDGPMVYLNQSNNPDAMTTVQVLCVVKIP